MDGLNFYVVDSETSGFKIGWAEITELSIIRCSDRNQLSFFIKAEHPERATPEALSVTNRKMSDLYKGISKKEAVEKVNSFLALDELTASNRCIIGHNVNFDMRFMHELWTGVGKELPVDNWLCTKSLSRSWANKLGIAKPKLTLAAALEFTGIKAMPGQHNAVSDARNTYLLWKKAVDDGIDYLPAIKRIPHIRKEEDKSLEQLVGEANDLGN